MKSKRLMIVFKAANRITEGTFELSTLCTLTVSLTWCADHSLEISESGQNHQTSPLFDMNVCQ